GRPPSARSSPSRCRAPSRAWRGTATGSWSGSAPPAGGLATAAPSRAREDPGERGREQIELLRGPDRDADRRGRAEPGQRPHDDALVQETVEEIVRVRA